ncbi:MAG: polymer-forming cytoskeletal protein [Nitrospirae bacterium]|nr:polymer-forming cytoskeletal protein [Nitrospirota bacterium]
MGATKPSADGTEPAWVMPLGSDIVLEGKLKFSGSMVLNGQFTGTIMSDGQLTLGPEALVKGDIAADSVLVEGKVLGNIRAKNRVQLRRTAKVMGDVISALFVVEEGAIFSGRSEMGKA